MLGEEPDRLLMGLPDDSLDLRVDALAGVLRDLGSPCSADASPSCGRTATKPLVPGAYLAVPVTAVVVAVYGSLTSET